MLTASYMLILSLWESSLALVLSMPARTERGLRLIKFSSGVTALQRFEVIPCDAQACCYDIALWSSHPCDSDFCGWRGSRVLAGVEGGLGPMWGNPALVLGGASATCPLSHVAGLFSATLEVLEAVQSDGCLFESGAYFFSGVSWELRTEQA